MLAERDPAERGRDDGAQQRQERHVVGRAHGCRETRARSEGSSDDREVGVAGEVPAVSVLGRPLDGDATGAAPASRRVASPSSPQRRGRRPALAEYDSGGHHGRGAEGGDAIASSVVPPRSTSRPTPDTGVAAMAVRRDVAHPGTSGKRRDQQRLHRDDRRGHATRKPICRDEQQREERADIQRPSTTARHHQLPWGSIGSARAAASGRESPDHGGEQRTSGGSSSVVTRYVVPQIGGSAA